MTAFDCTKCGACCAMYRVDLEGGDPSDFDTVPSNYYENGADGASMKGTTKLINYIERKTENSCVALVGAVGEKCACSIYDRRPRVCREFTPGGPMCNLARAMHGLSLADGYKGKTPYQIWEAIWNAKQHRERMRNEQKETDS